MPFASYSDIIFSSVPGVKLPYFYNVRTLLINIVCLEQVSPAAGGKAVIKVERLDKKTIYSSEIVS